MNDNEKKYSSDIPRPASYKKNNNQLPPPPKKIPPLHSNSDNEETQYISYNSYSDTAEINNNDINEEHYNYRNHSQNNSPYYSNHNPNSYENYRTINRTPEYDTPDNKPQHQPHQPPKHINQNRNIKNNNHNVNRKKTSDSPTNTPKPKKTKKRKKKSIITKILISILSVVTVVFLIYSIIVYSLIKKINYVKSDIVSYSGLMNEKHVKNILLIGTDGRSESERGRSDTMILLSINSKTDKIFLTSFMRDSYVDIDGHGWNKLNAAYSFGGAELLIDTIQRNFNIEITDYISVNFNAFASVVDAVDGIEIEISDKEAEAINKILHDEVNKLMGDDIDSDYLKGGGKVKLNGKQALSYSRIRNVGNVDFQRTQRQRDVLSKITEKIKSFNPAKLTKVIKSAAPEMTTNMTTLELYLLSLRAPFILGYDLEQLRVPADDAYLNEKINGAAVLKIDFEKNIDIIESEIFAD